ncbi:MAG: ADOP family duplicated permease, partial [Gemmatimonadota bacterium]
MADHTFRGLQRLFRIGTVRRDLDDELDHHFQRTVEELMTEGRSRREAEGEARRRFGDEERWRGELRRIDEAAASQRRRADLATAARDSFRFAWRGMRSSPGFATAVILAFALGIGANATMFGIVDRLLLRAPEGVVEPDRVVRVLTDQYYSFMNARRTSSSFTYPDFRDLQAAGGLESVAAYASRPLVLGRGAEALEVRGELASGTYFQVLGVEPALGRLFGRDDDVLGAPGVVVLSHDLWQSRFGGDRDVLGRTVDFGKGPWTVVGVAPRGFSGIDLSAVDLWLPIMPAQEAITGRTNWAESRNWWWMRVVARLAPGADPVAVETELTGLHRTARAELIEGGSYDPDARLLPASLIAARSPLASDESRVARWLAGVSLLVLLIACANVAGLQLARSLRRRREVAVRLALGISRGRLLAHILTESLLLAILGGAAAVLTTLWSGHAMRSLLLPDVAFGTSPVDGRVLLFIAVTAILSGLAAGVFPAFQASRPNLQDAIRSGGRDGQGRSARARNALTVLQAALSVVLLVGAGLFIASLDRIRAVDLGVELENVLLVSPDIDGTSGSTGTALRRAVMLRALERVQALPQVRHAAAAQAIPFQSTLGESLRLEGLDSVPSLPTTGEPTIVESTPGYAATMGLEVLRGRDLEAADMGGPPVALVDEVLARMAWPDGSAIGRCLYAGDGEAPCSTIVGVVEAAKAQQLQEEERMQYYIPLRAASDPWGILVRVRGEPGAAMEDVRRAVLGTDARVRFATVERMQGFVEERMRAWTLGAAMFTAFGILALLVAAFGLYAILAFGVAQRTRELGVRSALGATRDRLVRMVMADALRLTVVGLA